MALTSASTISDIVAAYVDNAAYDANASVSQAELFVNACRVLLVKRPKSVSHGGETIELDMAVMQEELKQGMRWLSGNRTVANGGAGVKHTSLEDFRS